MLFYREGRCICITEKDKDDFMDWCRNSGKMVELRDVLINDDGTIKQKKEWFVC